MENRTPTSDPRAASAQEGFTLAALIVVLTIISIVVAYTVPQQWSMVMRRERDRQTIFLMKQFALAIDRFEAKHKSLPVSLDQLEKARQPRFLRGNGIPINPLTGSEKDWIMVPPNAVQAGGGGAPGEPVLGSPMNRKQGTPGGQPGGAGAPAKLNKEASPKDYVGPFVGVRPDATGESFIELNEATDYSEWVYSVYDLRNERAARAAALVGVQTGARPAG